MTAEALALGFLIHSLQFCLKIREASLRVIMNEPGYRPDAYDRVFTSSYKCLTIRVETKNRHSAIVGSKRVEEGSRGYFPEIYAT